MDKYDRKIQLELLRELYNYAPYGIPTHDRIAYYREAFGSEDGLAANLIYLRDHGLIECNIQEYAFATGIRYIVMIDVTKITSKGIDFIRDDGGLSAILNVQTIKFHKDAVAVLEDLIALSNLSEPEKENAKSIFDKLSMEALKTVVQAATTAGINAIIK